MWGSKQVKEKKFLLLVQESVVWQVLEVQWTPCISNWMGVTIVSLWTYPKELVFADVRLHKKLPTQTRCEITNKSMCSKNLFAQQASCPPIMPILRPNKSVKLSLFVAQIEVEWYSCNVPAKYNHYAVTEEIIIELVHGDLECGRSSEVSVATSDGYPCDMRGGRVDI